jgi:hypothetical protein
MVSGDPWQRPTNTSWWEIDATDLLNKLGSFITANRERFPAFDQATVWALLERKTVALSMSSRRVFVALF